MRYKVTFAIGFAAGYVLGAKAGTERYEEIENAWRRFVDTPAVQQAAGVVGAQAGRAVDHAKHTVGDKVSDTVGAKLPFVGKGGRSGRAGKGDDGRHGERWQPERDRASAQTQPVVSPAVAPDDGSTYPS